ncbi:PadR family transcriptional regulator [Dactylosporangium sp. NBC_01737]|jgi:DNA-binding PadR family transcriptional regulator|uniref:PadR family transcriptional regulator n=1 Tax=Dactylosporangium sp. NBC_01737 TaxID=2975959 RepID=UPI002E0D4A6E|nr:PadR family transcriptional regulator [Dactylosporangium sp. NBC_01737]
MTIQLRAPSYFVLAALLDGELHGYVIIKRVEALSDGAVRLAAGSLYAVLDRLAEAGLVEVVSEEIVNGRARRYYALTEDGASALQDEAARLAAAAKVVTSVTARRRAVNTAVSPA